MVTKFNDINDFNFVDDVYNKYQKLDGKLSKIRFIKYLNLFIDITSEAFTGGEFLDRYSSMLCFSFLIKSTTEAKRFLIAVDSASDYS